MNMLKGNLKPAHAGYIFQDTITAYCLLNLVLGKYDQVTVDSKKVEDDRFDDLELTKGDRKTRIQIKSSLDGKKPISHTNFTYKNDGYNLRIDRLVRTFKQETSILKEFRLFATWQPPESTDELYRYIKPIDDSYTLPINDIHLYKLKAELIWPKNKEPVWKQLRVADDISRDDFLAFCEIFILELCIPNVSLDLNNPGQIEKVILNLLKDDIGIGRYPNISRTVTDVAGLVMTLANISRAQEHTLTLEDVVKALNIRTDFGRISQSFPLNYKHFHDRPKFRENTLNLHNESKIHLITGSPGIGKSWELTSLVEHLKKDYIVARHYCYLEPGDELVERRVTSDVLFANLIAELHDACDFDDSDTKRFSADITTLEMTLKKCAELDRSVILIIDGLDHIARVKESSATLNDNETDIIEQIATLNVPDKVKIIIGSQPGSHLQPIINRVEKDVEQYELSPWENNDIEELCNIHKVKDTLISLKINGTDEVLNDLAEKIDGNPLYATYLSKALVSGLNAGEVNSPKDWIQSVPDTEGDIEVYYSYLYEKLLKDVQAIADLLGVIEFSVTEAELKELTGPYSRWVKPAIKAIEPIIVNVAGQGGLRIFHESFRRFILKKLAEDGVEVSEILQPVIAWLTDKGFYESARSYRFLLPALRQANRFSEIFNIVDFDFVSKSISYGHTQNAIQSSIALTAHVASQLKNWPVLVRCIELRRSLFSCFYENEDWQLFWSSYADLFGHQSLSERLLFDGKPTLNFEAGIKACLIVDDLGGTAPWREYLTLPRNFKEDSSNSRFDTLYEMNSKQVCVLAQLQYGLSNGRGFNVLKWAVTYLSKVDNTTLSFSFIRHFGYRLSRNGLDRTALRLAERFGSKVDTDTIKVALQLGIADYYSENGNKEIAKQYAELALKYSSSPALISMCIDHGAKPLKITSLQSSVSNLDLGLGTSLSETNDVSVWVYSIRIIAHLNPLDSILDLELDRIRGVGWYRCWLKFVVELFKAEASSKYDICSIFNILLEEVHPFLGKPRACDLYYVHRVIEETIAIGLSLIKDHTEWAKVLETLVQVYENTSTRFDQEDGGPITVSTIINLSKPYIENNATGKLILSSLEDRVDYLKQRGSYYSTHATYEMELSSCYVKLKDINKAKSSWNQAGVYLSSYGWHKDITLFEIIESVSIHTSLSKDQTYNALDRLQPCISSAIKHTNGKETKHVPNRWFSELFNVSPENAIEVLVRTIQEESYIESWPTLRALGYIAEKLNGQANSILLNALCETLPFETKYETHATEIVPNRIKEIDSLYQTNPSLAKKRLLNLASKVANDNTRNNHTAIKIIEEYSKKIGFAINGYVEEDKSTTNTPENYNLSINSDQARYYNVPDYLPFPEQASLTDLFKGIRSIGNDNDYLTWLSVYLSYKLEAIAVSGNEIEANRIIFFYARQIGLFSRSDALKTLAECLETINLLNLATSAYTLAYAYSNGEGGWTVIGDNKQALLLSKAIELNNSLAKQILADDIGYRLRISDYGSGLTKAIIERVNEWAELEKAAKCWDEAFKVISHRLQLPSQTQYFAHFDSNNLIDWNVDEGLIGILLFRLSEPRMSRKLACISGIINAIKYTPELCIKPLIRWSTRDTPVTSLLLVFSLIIEFETEPFQITKGLSETLKLYVRSNIWGARVFSTQLLDRANITYNSVSIPNNVNTNYKKNLNDVYRFDGTHSLELLSNFQPTLPSQIDREFGEILKLECHRGKWREVAELSLGRDGKDYPPVDVLSWNFELFFSMLHQEANGIKEGMWLKGLWTKEREQYLVNETLPDTYLRLGLYHSRIPRPPTTRPIDAIAGESGIHIIDEDSEYNGWIRIAYIESEFLPSNKRSFSRPENMVRVFSAIVLTPIGSKKPNNFLPFLGEDVNTWSPSAQSNMYFGRPTNVWTEVVGLFNYEDWFGKVLVPTPPPEIAYMFNRTIKSEMNEKLAWQDENEEDILRLRTWSVRSEQLSSESPKLIGVDLIIRPDAFDELKSIFGCPMRTYTVKWEDKISKRD